MSIKNTIKEGLNIFVERFDLFIEEVYGEKKDDKE